MKHRRAFPLPKPELGEDRPKTIYRWLCRNGHRHAGNLYRDNPGTMPMHDETRDWMEDLAHRWDVFPGMSERKASDALERALDNAAKFVVDTFSVEYMEAAHERALNGYRLGISKARALKTGGVRVSPHIEWLREHPDMGATEAGRARKITRQQVNRIRARMVIDDAKRAKAEALADFNSLFPETYVEPTSEELDALLAMPVPKKAPAPVVTKVQNTAPAAPRSILRPSQPIPVHLPAPSVGAPSQGTFIEDRLAHVRLDQETATIEIDLTGLFDDETEEEPTEDLFDEWRSEHPTHTDEEVDDLFVDMLNAMKADEVSARDQEFSARHPLYAEAVALGLVEDVRE